MRFAEFSTLVPSLLSHLQECFESDGHADTLLGLAGRNVSKWCRSLKRDADAARTQLCDVRLDVTRRLPPHLLSRAGALVQRLQAAGYSAKQAGDAVDAVYCRRGETYPFVKLWAIFDSKCDGYLDARAFDDAMRILSGLRISDVELGAIRRRIGCVNAREIEPHELSAALRLLLPADGSAPRLRELGEESELSGLLGGAARVEKLPPLQRQRAATIAQRLLLFGYERPMRECFLQTLFNTRLHNEDLWKLWRRITAGAVDRPISLDKARHILAIISDEEGSEWQGRPKLDALVRKVDQRPLFPICGDPISPRCQKEMVLKKTKSQHPFFPYVATPFLPYVKKIMLFCSVRKVDLNRDGSLEFDEFALMLQATSPQRLRWRRIDEAWDWGQIEMHPLLDEVRRMEQLR